MTLRNLLTVCSMSVPLWLAACDQNADPASSALAGPSDPVDAPVDAPEAEDATQSESNRPQQPICAAGDQQSHSNLGTLVCVEPGKFTMGCVEGRDTLPGLSCDAFDDYLGPTKPAHEVELTRGFWIMQAEVTQAQYAAITGQNPATWGTSAVTTLEESLHGASAQLPVETVTWADAMAFADALSLQEGLKPCGAADDPYVCEGWRLPTAAEWEYAARAGQDYPFAGGANVNEVAWYLSDAYVDGDAIKSCDDGICTRAGCGKAQNALGLCDMSGNVSEWVWNWWDASDVVSETVDPTGPSKGEYRMARGGNWGMPIEHVRIVTQCDFMQEEGQEILGFRLVRTIHD